MRHKNEAKKHDVTKLNYTTQTRDYYQCSVVNCTLAESGDFPAVTYCTKRWYTWECDERGLLINNIAVRQTCWQLGKQNKAQSNPQHTSRLGAFKIYKMI